MKKISFSLIVLSIITISFFVWTYLISPNYTIDSYSKENAVISPTDSFTINFSAPIKDTTLSSDIKIFPKIEVKPELSKNSKSLVLAPATNWTPNTKYIVTIPNGQSKDLRNLNPSIHSFKIESPPKVTKILPKDGDTDVVLDIEDPIRIFVDKSTNDFNIDFSLSPKVPLSINKKGLDFEILPKESLQAGETYTLTVTIKLKNEKDSNNFIKKYSSSFTTMPPKPTSWSKNFKERLVQSKKYTKAKIVKGKYIDINLTNQVLSIFEDGKLLDNYMISSGKRGMNTPVGAHKIYNKFPRPFSKKYGLYMPNWMAFTPTGSHGIHELPEWPNGYKEGENHLGIPVSHGCVRLGVNASKRVYDWAEIGIPVIVYYGKI